MNYKKKSLILIIFFILIINILLLVNNRQKTSFKYFIWNIQDVSIGRLIFISFASGLIMSSMLNKTLNINNKIKPTIEESNKTTDENNYPVNNDDNNDPYEITPERDLRDPQPTISVNYRVIKNNDENELRNRSQKINNSQYDDWNDAGSEW